MYTISSLTNPSPFALTFPFSIVKDQIYVGSVLKTIVELPNGKEVKVNNHPDATVYPDGTAVSVYWEPDKAVVIHTKEDKMYDAIEDAVLK